MKTILVATDFTPAATNAMFYAVKLARPLNAKVILYHAYLTETYIPDFVLLPTETNLQEQCENLLKLELDLLDPLDRLIVEAKCEPGIPSDKILEAAKTLDASLVVAGMKKSGKTYRKLFGTTALTISRKSSVPVLVIPEECHFDGLKTIALASDMHVKSNPDFAEAIIGLAERFHSNVFVVSIVNNEAASEIQDTDTAFDINWRLKDISPGYIFIQDEKVGSAIGKFVEENQVDMLAMVAHPHSIVEKLFVKSNIKEMMFEGNVPLLVLPDKKKAENGSHEVAGKMTA
jgi:nucleotide-binding universal stress UspA family protein